MRAVEIQVGQTQLRVIAALALLVAACPAPDLPKTPPKTIGNSEGIASVGRCSNESREEKRVTVVARAVERKQGPAIQFRLTNVSTETLHLYPFDLPWGNLNAVEYAATTSSRHALTTVWPIDDPASQQPIAIPPHQVLEGEVLLVHRILDVNEAHTREDIYVNWCYRFGVIGDETGGHLSGQLKVPRRALSNSS